MKVLRLIIGLLLFAALLNVARAQDTTPDATPEATEIVILNATAVPTVEATAEATPLPLSESDKVTFSWTVVSQLAMTIVVSFLAGGLTVGGGILLALRTILRSPLLSNMVEKLFLSQPIEKRDKERGIVKGLKEVAEGIDKLTDGVLESETPTS